MVSDDSPISMVPLVFRGGVRAAEDDEVRTKRLMEVSLAAASRACFTPLTALVMTLLGSVPKDVSEA